MRLKERIESSKVELNRNEGKLDSLFKKLKKDHSIETIKEATDFIAKTTKQIQLLKRKMEKDIAFLEDHYDI